MPSIFSSLLKIEFLNEVKLRAMVPSTGVLIPSVSSLKLLNKPNSNLLQSLQHLKNYSQGHLQAYQHLVWSTCFHPLESKYQYPPEFEISILRDLEAEKLQFA